jgi:hypothetical protein
MLNLFLFTFFTKRIINVKREDDFARKNLMLFMYAGMTVRKKISSVQQILLNFKELKACLQFLLLFVNKIENDEHIVKLN